MKSGLRYSFIKALLPFNSVTVFNDLFPILIKSLKSFDPFVSLFVPQAKEFISLVDIYADEWV